VGGSAPEAGLLVFSSRARNESCSVTRNVRNLGDDELAVRIIDANGTVIDERDVGADRQVTFVVDHFLVTVPLFVQAGDDAPVELAQVGPYAPCDAPTGTVPTSPTTPTSAPPSTSTPTSTPTTPATTTTPTSAPTRTSPSPEPTVTTLGPPTTLPPSVGTVTTVAVDDPPATPATVAPTATAPPVSVLSAQVTVPGGGTTRLPTTGASTRPTLVLGLSAIAVGAAFLLTARTSRRRLALAEGHDEA
jgi:hypothetical protein